MRKFHLIKNAKQNKKTIGTDAAKVFGVIIKDVIIATLKKLIFRLDNTQYNQSQIYGVYLSSFENLWNLGRFS